MSGDIDHRDYILTDDEEEASETIMICAPLTLTKGNCPKLVLAR
ncbi:hypothetical protein [Corynebacterium deserti]|nr:hypothetical protein [Corynebacterium deserti]